VHNALSVHARRAGSGRPWLAGHALGHEAAQLIGLGPGLTPSGDDYLGGVLVALRWLGRGLQANSLWRWLEPRLASQTSEISATHLAAAASGQVHEALHTGKSWSPTSIRASPGSMPWATPRAGMRSPASWRWRGPLNSR
jgi:hypothetical protein